MPQQQLAKDERSLGDLFGELAAETGTLVKHEVALAQAEITGKALAVGKDLGVLAVGGVIAHVAVLALVAAVTLLLAQFIPAWLAALLVGLAIGAAAYFVIMSALARLKKMDPAPRQSIESIKEDAEWLKNEVT